MAFDETAATNVRRLLDGRDDVTERRMFGGLAFLVRGHMLCAVGRDHFMVRTGPEACADALRRPHASPMRFTGRTMNGYVTVAPPGYADARSLASWLDLALAHVQELPPKVKSTTPKPRHRAPRTG